MTADLVQGSEEWKAARAGRVTASRIADLMARTKTGWGASRANLMATLISERLTGVPAEGFTTDAMRWGIETEAEARAAYEFVTGSTVAEVGFVPHPVIRMSGASPDGLVDDDGLVEIKCPNTATHIETLIGGSIPSKYVKQMLWQMRCTNRRWCDFVSFDNRMPESMKLFVRRIRWDEEQIVEIEKAVVDFLAEMDEKIATLQRMYGSAA
ncbi:exonuclease [Rhodoplanes elegans]|uniref:Exonuclease n=1 Tax=Rhodoplanes elegans TaxID=29408 RepID=A0A327KSQ9_9BRAD|nr:lambda exonuclease family protein [Rhodoplanes elegans]MBK5958056.1 exonuclease [Rhodoplanes elegans]MBK5958148.1 exonuclease [Rhodoplanes elegans]RAI40435.1 exonuclease [Rhodoplanes elegans]